MKHAAVNRLNTRVVPTTKWPAPPGTRLAGSHRPRLGFHHGKVLGHGDERNRCRETTFAGTRRPMEQIFVQY